MIDHETLEHIAAVAASFEDLNEKAMKALKQTCPNLRFTFCNDDDMPARLPPAVRREKFNLYLFGSGEHCISLTDDLHQAIGVVLAQVDDLD